MAKYIIIGLHVIRNDFLSHQSYPIPEKGKEESDIGLNTSGTKVNMGYDCYIHLILCFYSSISYPPLFQIV